MSWYLMIWQRYAEFGGRSRRREYWYSLLFHLIFQLAFIGIFVFALPMAFVGYSPAAGFLLGTGALGVLGLYQIATFIPLLAVMIRRLHDTGRSGWYFFIGFIPLVGTILLIVWLAQKGHSNSNAWGPNPGAIEWGEVNDSPKIDIYASAKAANVRPGDTCNTCGARLAKQEQALGVCTSCIARS